MTRALILLSSLLLFVVVAGCGEDNPTGNHNPPISGCTAYDSLQAEGSVDLHASGGGVFVEGNYAYVSTSSAFKIIDVSNPAGPAIVGSLVLPGDTGSEGLTKQGNYVYVANGFSGLAIVDVTNPTAPTLAGTGSTGDNTFDVAVVGTHAYVGFFYGFLVFDVSNPAHLAITGGANTGVANGVAVVGNYAYVAASDHGLRIVDVSDPDSVYIAKTVATPGYAEDVAIQDGYAYLADGDAGLTVVNVTNPLTPILRGSSDTSNFAIRVAIDGDRAFINEFHGNLVVFAISPSIWSPTNLGATPLPGANFGLAALNERVYIGANGPFLIFHPCD